MRGTDLKPTASKGAPEGARDSEACQCFVELRVLGRSYVSPVAPQGGSPEWHWTFWVPVDEVPTIADYASLRFTAINFMARKQPQVQLHSLFDGLSCVIMFFFLDHIHEFIVCTMVYVLQQSCTAPEVHVLRCAEPGGGHTAAGRSCNRRVH